MAKKDWMIIESELDDDQIKVLTATLDKSCVVSGCAGSGKSVLALIKAQRIQKEKGNDYQIIVFTKALSKYMNSGKETLGLNNDFTYHWNWKNRMEKLSSKYFIVDEIQDFTKEEILEFIESTKNNFFFFGDTAQSIYGGLKETLPLDEISMLFPREKRPKSFELYRNYRLPIPVARFVQYVGVGLDGFDEDTYKSTENERPRLIQYSSFNEQVNAISRIIKEQGLKDVAILLPHNNMVDYFFNLLTNTDLNCELKSQTRDTLDFNTSNPKITTYHSAKGLQFETVFLPDLHELEGDTENEKESFQKSFYVAITRTYRYVYLMYSGARPSLFDRIPCELYQSSEINDVEDI